MIYFPRLDYVLVEPRANQTMTPGGLHIPPAADNYMRTGLVIAVGRGLALDGGGYDAPEVEVGDVAVFNAHGVVRLEGATQVLVRACNIYAVLRG